MCIRDSIQAGLTVLYCIGETAGEQEHWQEVLKSQLETGLKDVDKEKVVIAYEPIWAIGPGKTPPEMCIRDRPHDPVLINTVRLMQKEIDVCPSRNSNGKFPEAISLVNEGKVPTDAIITKMIELDQVEDTIKEMCIRDRNCVAEPHVGVVDAEAPKQVAGFSFVFHDDSSRYL